MYISVHHMISRERRSKKEKPVEQCQKSRNESFGFQGKSIDKKMFAIYNKSMKHREQL